MRNDAPVTSQVGPPAKGFDLLKAGRLVRGRDVNGLILAINAFLRLVVNRNVSNPDDSGTYVFDALVSISDQNVIVDLWDPPIGSSGKGGSATLTPMQVQSYTTANDYLSAKNATFAAGVWTASGSAVNVALPWELRPAQNPGGQTLSPPYAVNDIIFVVTMPTGENGVVVGGIELTLLDSALGRTWTQSVGIRYRGTYSSLVAYAVNDVVRVQTGGSQGVWICVAVPGAGLNPPTFPEPATTGGTNFWEMFSFGIQTTSVCSGGTTKTQYFNATPPI